jgi:hypothetical protein
MLSGFTTSQLAQPAFRTDSLGHQPNHIALDAMGGNAGHFSNGLTENPSAGDFPRLAKAPALKFQGAGVLKTAMAPVNGFVSWFTRNLYDQGEGVRYLVEQTLGYTAPRTYQQLNRTRDITGESNPAAAKEMLIRDLAADFADTILPGLLATYGIGKTLDYFKKTVVGKNMGHEALSFYEGLAHPLQGSTSKNQSQEFFKACESLLLTHANVPSSSRTEGLGLLNALTQAKSESELDAVVKQLASALKLSDYDMTLKNAGQEFKVSLPNFVRDLWHLNEKSKNWEAILPEVEKTVTEAVTEKVAQAASSKGSQQVIEGWGEKMAQLLSRTKGFTRWQMIGNAVALAASISIPFGIRMMTKWHYGEDAFPGTRELESHFKTGNTKNSEMGPLEKGQALSSSKSEAEDKKKFHLFPYLHQSFKQGKYLPTLLTMGFFGVLAGAVTRRFNLSGLSMGKLSNWFKVYEFQRSFPFTTVEQMELTYGLLCGVRLASSRDEAEFRETGIRDCLLGWPTLTYFFPWFREKLSHGLSGSLTKSFRNKNLLIKPNGAVRTGDEISKGLFSQMNLTGNVDDAVSKTKLTQSWITFLSAGVSWVLLAFAEPKFGIWLTNHMETKRIQKEKAVSIPKSEIPPPNFMGGVSLRSTPNGLFENFERHRFA